MGNLLVSYLWRDDVIVNETTKLTRSELEAVKRSWQDVRKDSANVGMAFFMELFRQHPGYQLLFPSFSDLPPEALLSSSKFRAHAVTVMYALTSFLDHMDDPECLTAIVHKTAANHVPRKATGQHFRDFTCLIIGGLKERYGLSPVAERGWNKVILVMDQTFQEGQQMDS